MNAKLIQDVVRSRKDEIGQLAVDQYGAGAMNDLIDLCMAAQAKDPLGRLEYLCFMVEHMQIRPSVALWVADVIGIPEFTEEELQLMDANHNDNAFFAQRAAIAAINKAKLH